VQVIDMAKLQDLAKAADVELAVLSLPGSFVHPKAELARVIAGKLPDPSCVSSIMGCFVIGQARTFDQDPRFGVLTLTEIASRALSPAGNDRHSGPASAAVGAVAGPRGARRAV
jgi:uncharacterized membrane protein